MAGAGFIAVRWVEGWPGVLNALHKNGFRGLNYNWGFLLIASLGMLVVDVLPFVGWLVWSGPAALLFAGAIACIGLCYLAAGIYAPASVLAFPAHPVTSLLFNAILWRSALSTLKHGGVGWRGTVYPIDRLRKNSENL
jgi:hypothetical protein